MHNSAFLTLAISALAAAAPTKRDSTYYEVGLSIRTSSGMTQPGVYEPAPVVINQLTTLGDSGVSASEIKFDGTSSNVDISAVECRAYKDLAGVQPGSAPFTLVQPAELSTNLVTISSILCYITESS